jgi:hypothetical protein
MNHTAQLIILQENIISAATAGDITDNRGLRLGYFQQGRFLNHLCKFA